MHQVQIFPAPDAGAIVVFDTRESIAAAVEALIARMDELDGDPDVEPNGDELDGSMSEDEFCQHSRAWRNEPGCPVGDPGEQEHTWCPDYGDDQRGLPTNIAAANRSHALSLLTPKVRAMQRGGAAS